MLRSELTLKVAEISPRLRRREAEAVVTAILDTVADTLARGGRVELRGFGTFTLRRRSAKRGRNPRTGKAVEVPERDAVYFRPSRDVLRRLQPSTMA